MKLANPLYYPLAVLAGGVFLVVGVRLLGISHSIALPIAAAVATAGAAFMKGQEPESLGLDPALEREFMAVQAQAKQLVEKSQELRTEAAKVLTAANQMDLLVAVENACTLTDTLPDKLSQMVRRFQGTESLLSVEELQRQLTEVQTRMKGSTGIAREQLSKLADSLRRNIQLAQEGQDARQAQMVSLSTLIIDAAGVLQKLQNQLRTANLENAEDMELLQALSQDFSNAQSSVELLIAR